MLPVATKKNKPLRHQVPPRRLHQVMNWNILADLYATENVPWLGGFLTTGCWLIRKNAPCL